MHTVTQLYPDMFEAEIEGATSALADVLPGWGPLDRLGVIVDEPLGGLGASHMIQVAIVAYYEHANRRGSDLSLYPEIYAFHFGRPRGTLSAFDFWPPRREVMVSGDPLDLLDAINDRGITRLLVPDRPTREIEYRPKEADAALDRTLSAFAYSASGRTDRADVRLTGTARRTEINPTRALRPVYVEETRQMAKPFKEADARYKVWLKAREGDVTPAERDVAEQRRASLLEGGTVSETYRRIGTREALARMAGCNAL